MFDSVHLERLYPHSPERLWTALTDPRAIAEWLMPNDFEARVGHKFRFQIDPAPGLRPITLCEVVEVDPPRRLAYTWQPVKSENDRPTYPPSLVTWTLRPEGAGTRLILDHTGLRGPFRWWERLMLRSGWGTIVKRWIGMVAEGVGPDQQFTPGIFPLHKRCYKANRIPSSLIR